MKKFLLIVCLLSSTQSISQANIQSNIQSGCAPLQVSFSPVNVTGTILYWDFGNGYISSQANPTVVYQNSGVYTVKLIYQTSTSVDTVTLQNYITVQPKPVAGFSQSVQGVCPNNNLVTLTNGSTGNNLQFNWDFGDGVSSNSSQPNHTYDVSGTFSIHLTVTNQFGCSSVYQGTPINIAPVPSPSIIASDSLFCDLNQAIGFSTNSPSGNPVTWDFGDGSLGTGSSTQHIFSSYGTYQVTATSTSPLGCSGASQPLEINIDPLQCPVIKLDSLHCIGETIRYQSQCVNYQKQWQLNGLLISSSDTAQIQLTQSGTYILELTLDDGGCSSTVVVDSFIVMPLPNASFNLNGNHFCIGNAAIATPTTTLGSHLWTINANNNGPISTNLVFYPNSEGLYDITHYLQDSVGCESSSVQSVNFHKPVASFSVQNNFGCAPHSTSVQNTSTSATIFEWILGNGNTISGYAPTLTYINPGQYAPILVASDSFGCVDSTQLSFNIYVDSTTYDYDPLYIEGCAPYDLGIDGSNLGYNQFLWNISGDTTVYSGAFLNQTFSAPGIYHISLQTQNSNGCSVVVDSAIIIEVHNPINPAPYLVPDCANFSMELQDSSGSATGLSWTYGNQSGVQGDTVYPNTPLFEALNWSHVDGHGCVETGVLLFQMSGCGNGSASNPSVGGQVSIPTDTLIVCAPYYLSLDVQSLSISNFNHWDVNGTTYTQPYLSLSLDSAGLYTVSVIKNNYSDTLYLPFLLNVHEHVILQSESTTALCDSTEFSLANNSVNSINSLWNYQGQLDSNSAVSIKIPDTQNYLPVHLISWDHIGCVAQKSTVFSNSGHTPVILQPEKVCQGATTNFSLVLSGAQNIIWNFGDGQSSTGAQVSHVYNNSGYFTGNVSYSIGGCTHLLALDEIQVVHIDPGFSVADTFICRYDTCMATAYSPNMQSYQWYVDGNLNSMQPNISMPFSSIGNKLFVLQVTNDICTATDSVLVNVSQPVNDFSVVQSGSCIPFTATISPVNAGGVWEYYLGSDTIHQNSPVLQIDTLYPNGISGVITNQHGCSRFVGPKTLSYHQTNFETNNNSGCAPFTAQFNDLTSGATSWFWDFGDGQTSMQQNPSHTYNGAGNYTVTLVTTAADGCYDTLTLSNYIHVSEIPVFTSASFSSGCLPVYASFSDTTPDAIQWLWSFGDSSFSAQQNPSHVYSNPGNYTVTLTVTNVYGCTGTDTISSNINVLGPTFNIALSDSSICLGDSILLENLSSSPGSYSWTFDSTTSSINPCYFSPSAAGTYDISLSITDSAGCTNSIDLQGVIEVYPVQTLSLSITDSVLCLGDSATVFGSQTNSPLTWQHNSQTQISYDYTFVTNSTGTQLILASIFDTNGCSASDSIQIHVDAPVQVQLSGPSDICADSNPIIISHSPNGGSWLGPIQNNGLFDPNGLTNGIHTIYYSFSSNACSNSDSIEIEVHSPVSAEFDLPSELCLSKDSLNLNPTNLGTWNLISITNNAVAISDLPIDSTTAITHIVSNGVCADTVTKEVHIHPLPLIDFSIEETLICENQNLNLQFNSNSSALMHWYFSSEDTAFTLIGEPNLDLTSGDWSISLSVSDSNGCYFQSLPIDITVLDTIAPSPARIIRTTVIEDVYTYTEWELPKNNIVKIEELELLRHGQSGETLSLGTFIPESAYYTDYDVDVQNEIYTYEIITKNRCSTNPNGSKGNSIVLKASALNGLTEFDWNHYLYWNQGVGYYELQKLDSHGQWKTVKVLLPSESSTVH